MTATDFITAAIDYLGYIVSIRTGAAAANIDPSPLGTPAVLDDKVPGVVVFKTTSKDGVPALGFVRRVPGKTNEFDGGIYFSSRIVFEFDPAHDLELLERREELQAAKGGVR